MPAADNVDFRLARPEDIAACIVLRGLTRENAVPAERLAAVGITEASWGGDVRSGKLIGHLAFDGAELMGYCFGDKDTGEIVVLALLPAHEGQGLGKQLLDLVVADLRAAGWGRLFLGCSADPAHRSHGFYRHLGWQPTGEVDKYGDEVLELRATP